MLRARMFQGWRSFWKKGQQAELVFNYPFIIKILSRGVATHPRPFLTLVTFRLTPFFILTDNKLNAGNLLSPFHLILNCSIYYLLKFWP